MYQDCVYLFKILNLKPRFVKYVLEQRSAKFYCKGSDSNVSIFADHIVSVAISQS